MAKSMILRCGGFVRVNKANVPPAGLISNLTGYAWLRGFTHISVGWPHLSTVPQHHKLLRLVLSACSFPTLDHMRVLRNKDWSKVALISMPYVDDQNLEEHVAQISKLEANPAYTQAITDEFSSLSWWYPGRTGLIEFGLVGFPKEEVANG
jgi:hypothetical protein